MASADRNSAPNGATLAAISRRERFVRVATSAFVSRWMAARSSLTASSGATDRAAYCAAGIPGPGKAPRTVS